MCSTFSSYFTMSSIFRSSSYRNTPSQPIWSGMDPVKYRACVHHLKWISSGTETYTTLRRTMLLYWFSFRTVNMHYASSVTTLLNKICSKWLVCSHLYDSDRSQKQPSYFGNVPSMHSNRFIGALVYFPVYHRSWPKKSYCADGTILAISRYARRLVTRVAHQKMMFLGIAHFIENWNFKHRCTNAWLYCTQNKYLLLDETIVALDWQKIEWRKLALSLCTSSQMIFQLLQDRWANTPQIHRI